MRDIPVYGVAELDFKLIVSTSTRLLRGHTPANDVALHCHCLPPSQPSSPQGSCPVLEVVLQSHRLPVLGARRRHRRGRRMNQVGEKKEGKKISCGQGQGRTSDDPLRNLISPCFDHCQMLLPLQPHTMTPKHIPFYHASVPPLTASRHNYKKIIALVIHLTRTHKFLSPHRICRKRHDVPLHPQSFNSKSVCRGTSHDRITQCIWDGVRLGKCQ